MLSSVDSWPPCIDDAEVKTPAGLRSRPPLSHIALVPSRKYLSGAAMLPNRVGLPSTSPSQARSSSWVAYGAPAGGTAGSVASLVGDTAGTVRSRAVAPGTDSTPRATCRASSAVAPFRE